MVEIIRADFSDTLHAEALVSLMSAYARDPMGGGKDLAEDVKANLASALYQRDDVHVILAYVEGKPIGLVTCIEGFSTFRCKPLLNIHDVIVISEYRGQGISRLLLKEAENIAMETGCCKLTLEVLEGNQAAQAAYVKFGFSGYELDPKMGKALFWEKTL